MVYLEYRWKLLRETWPGNTLIPLYDNEESVCGILYNGTPYYFIKNLQGDVIEIVNANAETVAKYSYDAWGICTVTQNSAGIASVNPFRYRSYYYDEETELYYLQSRYYDASAGRFISEDDAVYLRLNQTPNSFVLFTYCNNDPMSMLDVSGTWPKFINRALNAIKGGIYNVLFKSVRMSHWTGIVGQASRASTTEQAIFNYESNKKLESTLIYTSGGYIDDQQKLKKWKLGFQSMDICGCEVIAVYNALKALGMSYKLSDLVLHFELSGYMMLYGYFGSDPTELWRIFTSLGLKYDSSFTFSVVERRLKKAKIGIVSCWNENITMGLHTFAVQYNKQTQKFRAYNGYDNNGSKKKVSASLKDLVYTSACFIKGYTFK